MLPQLVLSATFAATALAVPQLQQQHQGSGMVFCCGSTGKPSCGDQDLTELSLAWNAAGTSVAIKATVDGTAASCPAEATKITSGAGPTAVNFTSIGSGTDCLNKLLVGAGAQSTDLTVTLTKGAAPSVHVAVQGGPDVTLKSCGKDGELDVATAPPVAGSQFCGSYQDLVKELRIGVVNNTAVNISATVAPFGGKGVPASCVGEPIAFKSTPTGGAVTLPGLSKATDCLGRLFSKFSAPSVDITYEAKTDTLLIDASGQATINMKKCP